MFGFNIYLHVLYYTYIMNIFLVEIDLPGLVK